MNLLVTEDDPVNLLLVKGILAPLGHSIFTAVNGTEAKALIESTQFDMLLLDVMMPDIDGFTLARLCRQDPRHRDVPILIITALSGKNDLIKGFEAGATDYVSKPFHATELLHRVRAHLQTRSLQLAMEKALNDLNLRMLQVDQQQQELEAKEKQLMESNRLLAEANRALMDFASKDALTGLLNRRKGWDYMNYEEERSRRTQKPIGVALLDVDKFKSINDTLGHDVGDLVLKTVSDCLAGVLRAADVLIRWGGEEFLVILPETDESGLALVAEKLRLAVESHPWALKEARQVTVSIGTTVKQPTVAWERAVETADRALYVAKESGRNRVEFEPS